MKRTIMKTDTLRSFLGILCAVILAATGAVQAADSPTFKVGDKTFTRPAAWQALPLSSPLRLADLKIPSADGKTNAEVVFFQFGTGAGGSVQANIDRWLGQFAEPKDKINSKVENVTVGKTQVTYVSAQGTYNSGMPGGPTTPTPDSGLLGAIVGNPGDNLIFVRMTGPKALVASSNDDFKKMVESALK